MTAYNIQAVVWWRNYNMLLTTVLYHEIGSIWRLNSHGGVPYGQFARYADYNLDCYEL